MTVPPADPPPTSTSLPANYGPAPRVRPTVDWELTLWLVVAAVLGALAGVLFAVVTR